jgi:succinate dehydrogenase / fumarate reductase, cytochrome b subunit
MTWKQMFTSSIGKKFVMALTGLFLISFLVVHVGLNACIWANDNGEMFNVGAHFMGSTVVVRIMEIGLFLGIILHLIQGYILTAEYQKKRSVGYAVSYGDRGSKWYSRSMGLLGTLLLLFLIMHIYHFWVPSRLGGIANITPLQDVNYPDSPKVYHDLYGEMLRVFQNNLLIVILYVLGCISLAYHLMHGFESSFRTIGVHNNRYLKMLRYTGRAFAIIVSAAFAMMPISMYLGWVH